MSTHYWVLDGPAFDSPSTQGLPVRSRLQGGIERIQVMEVLRDQAVQAPRTTPEFKRVLHSISVLEAELSCDMEEFTWDVDC